MSTELTLCSLNYEVEKEKDKGNSLVVQIRIWCLDKLNIPYLLRIEDYFVHFYYEFPLDVDYNIEDAKELHDSLKAVMGANKKFLLPFLKEDFCDKYVLYYYQPKPRKMCKLKFANLDSARHATNVLKKNKYLPITETGKNLNGGRVLEAEIDVIRKLLTDRKMTHCNWFTCQGIKETEESDKISRLEREYMVSYTSLTPIICEDIVRPLWVSFDAEMYSHNHKAFSNKWSNRDQVYLITMTFFRDGDQNVDNWMKYAVLVGDCDKNDIDPTLKANIICLRRYRDAMKKYAELILEHDPDFITGYNILPFDNRYFDCQLKLIDEEWPEMGRLKGRTGPARNITWGSDAYGKKDMYLPYVPGRCYLDLFEHVRRTKNLPSYSLKNVAIIILKDPTKQKKDVEPEQQFKAYDAMKLSIKNKTTEGLKEMSKVVDYGLWDALLPCYIANKIYWWIGIREMGNAVGVGPQTLLTNGQQVRVQSLLYDQCTNMNIVLDTRLLKLFYYEGGLVQQPDVGLHKIVFTLDFKSLYPSAIIGNNLCYTTLINPKEHDLYRPEDYIQSPVKICDQDDADTELDSNKKKDLVYRETDFRFVKATTKEGVLPIILKRLVAERARVRKEKTDDPIKKVVNEERQLALKVCANSVYGFTGVKKGAKRSCLEVAATTCFIGRESITKVIKWIQDNYEGHLVYGDTDSCMITIKGISIMQMHALAKKIAAEVSKLFPPPMELEMEGVYDMLAVKQKNYAKYTYWDPTSPWTPKGMGGKHVLGNDGLPELTIKGMSPTRRDTCQLCKDILIKQLHIIMLECGYWECFNSLFYTVMELYSGEVETDQLIISKSLGANYKEEGATMKVFANQMALLGKQLNAGERHEYVVVNVAGEKKIGKKMLLLSVYNNQKDKYEIDAEYYFKNLLMKKFDTIIGAGYKKDAKKLEKISMTIRGREITANTPAKMLYEKIKIELKNNSEEGVIDLDEFYNTLANGLKNKGIAI